ncbi:1-acyl-sn-glycerol-3-phosphate acyltransferase delta [Tupaia chinensis]|uniref:1-acyl-sn-glycerol-3-phosphate acyltransferase delta n=1 Tax=Tupaia chinensis TaxID=246437 RepID=L9KKH9_TUPCH|nr:1-acyl-sn-glycerol-3-phosphate acyltransferase delta [Tupaia chinensis]
MHCSCPESSCLGPFLRGFGSRAHMFLPLTFHNLATPTKDTLPKSWFETGPSLSGAGPKRKSPYLETANGCPCLGLSWVPGCIPASVGVRWMIGVTEIDKGSAYGDIDNKQKQND